MKSLSAKLTGITFMHNFLYTTYDIMKITGHRGAAGLELENTMPGFKLAKNLGVDAIELDIRLTKDQKFVVCHDNNLRRVSTSKAAISDLLYSELSHIKLHNNFTVPLLTDVLTLIDNIPVIIDIKIHKNLPELMDIIDHFPDIDFTIVGRPNTIIEECKRLRPDIPAFIGKCYTPFGIMRAIKNHRADGLNLQAVWLNPLLYKTLQKRGYQVQVYSVDSVLLARLMKRLYPGIWICTNRPDKLIKALRK